MLCMVPGDDAIWLSQLRRGSAEHCVLALLRPGEKYGFDLARILTEGAGLIASEGTIYPLLARLRRNGLVATTWRESVEGPPRRYYRLTDAGEAALHDFIRQWKQFREAVDSILEGVPST
jgi:PadR family transcriptional regulator PadR